ncbi:thyroglobulin [Amia ocellicauda]|uniref:thyroglobulin n=1 Tax=Amia ocellicauda TaxID=2972642 RepID=UPI003463BE27
MTVHEQLMLLWAISDYQLESQSLSQCELLRDKGLVEGGDYIPQCLGDGRFRNVQCNADGSWCWCVNAEGAEIPNSKQNGSAVHCLSSCQQHRQRVFLSGAVELLPQCSDSGEYESVQCDAAQSQCWCVDAEGTEVYGTRQNGHPDRCPGACEVIERRQLHGIGQRSPPQCAADGSFLPVQCKFINMTDSKVFDLLHTFNRLPEVFQTFSGFRRMFPDISGFCFCADSRGRDLGNTGVEMLLDEVYDTAFSGLDPGSSFTESNMYRILQRRFLAIQLAMSGRFRCPTPCEKERYTAAQTGNVFSPSCDNDGAYSPVQCQAGGQCWCVDATGKEVTGTRRQGGLPDCGDGLKDCPSERRRGLSRLFYGPSGYFSQNDVFSVKHIDEAYAANSLSPCNPDLRELFAKSGLLLSLPELNSPNVGAVFGEIIQGLFPSGEMVLRALRLTTNPKRLQENLFGGKFLKNVGNFNFTGAVGPKGSFSFSKAFEQLGLKEISGSEGFAQLAKLFSLDTNSKPESLNLDQKIQDSFGRVVNLKDNQNLVQLVIATLSNEQFFTTLGDIFSTFRPESTKEVGTLFQAVFQNAKPEACDRDPSVLFVPQCTKSGQYEEVQCLGSECWCVDSQGREIPGSRSDGQRPRCLSKCEKEREMAKLVKASQSAGAEVFIPKCEADGSFMPVQCLGSNCFCMDNTGTQYTRTTPDLPILCPTPCQAKAGQQFLSTVQSLLSSPAAASRLSDVYIPQCSASGSWREIQCDGPPEQAFQFYQEWVQQNNAGKGLPVPDLLNTIREYQKLPEALSSLRGFVKELYSAGHHKVFPVFSKYAVFDDVPAEKLEGNTTSVSSSSVFLDPLTLWRLLLGNSTQYPGPYSDFNVPLGHFELRQCWCADENGERITGTEAKLNEIPKCAGRCALVTRQVSEFLQEAEEIIKVSNSSHLPFGFTFLQARGLQLIQEELLYDIKSLQAGPSFSEVFLRNSDSALRLAAHTTLHFYWQTNFSAVFSQRQGFLLGYQPYQPQCDAYGQWQPTQCYESTGHCWCVDEEGSYIPGSLTSRSLRLPQCGTPCQRAHTRALLSDWRQSDLSASGTTLYKPSCQERGEYTVLQNDGTETGLAWCVSSVTGKPIQPALHSQGGSPECPGWCGLLKSQVLRREAGLGYVPQCRQEGALFAPVQCDQRDCWCVFPSGQEAPGTRLRQDSGEQPACDTPRCPLPFGVPNVHNGAVFCSDFPENGQQRQQCQITCRHGYQNALSENNFLCDVVTNNWVSAEPLPDTCQKPQLFQTVQAQTKFQLSLAEGKKACSSERPRLQSTLLQDLRAQGLCNLQTTFRGKTSSVSICDDSAVALECVSSQRLMAEITWKAQHGDFPIAALPDSHDIDSAFASANLVKGVVDLIKSGAYQPVLDPEPFPPDVSIDFSPVVQFGCLQGYQMLSGFKGCVICPAGTFANSGVCTPCPHGSYQHQEGSDFCNKCPQGRSTVSKGAFKATHCVTPCEEARLRLQCTKEGEFRAAQSDAESQKWFCVTDRGDRLDWTAAAVPLTDSQCRVMQKFEDVPKSQWILNAEDVIKISSDTANEGFDSQLQRCISVCASDPSCHHLSIVAEGGVTRCDYYSTAETNIKCSTAGKTKGFLGNSGTDMYQNLSCLVKLQGNDKQGLVVLRKKGYEFTTRSQRTFERQDFQKAGSGVYQTLVFPAGGATLTDVHYFCRETCKQESCCDGFILNENILNGGTVMCGLLSHPDVFLCRDQDWDEAAQSGGKSVCAAGITYDKLRKQFTFNFGGQNFNITDAALPATSKNKTNYQATIIGFQRIYLWKESDMTTRPKSPQACARIAPQEGGTVTLPEVLIEAFIAVESNTIDVDPYIDIPSQQYWIFKHEYSAQKAQLWCLNRCDKEEFCKVADLQDNSTLYFTCTLYPDTRVCGAYNKPIRQSCSLVLPVQPQIVHEKKLVLMGSVKDFYSRIPFRKLVAYSVRSRVNQTGKPITDRFYECERRCDEDSCCKGFGFVRDSQSPGKEVLCLTLNSVGVQACGGQETSWSVMDCTAARFESEVYPFGFYQKPANRWNQSPSICPTFHLPPPPQNVTENNWEQLHPSSVVIDPSVSKYDVIHISKDLTEDFNKSRNWCLSACQGSDSCSTVSVDVRESAVRCILYPDTHSCTPSSRGLECNLLLKEPGLSVFHRKDFKLETTVFIPSHGVLLGGSQLITVGLEETTVKHFLGVPFALPPTGINRFSAPQSPRWTGTWNATYARPSCIQPGNAQTSAAAEDCLYLNIFVPNNIRGNASVLVFFHNTARDVSSNGQYLMDGSHLAAVGSIIVVTGNFRVGAFGFLSTGSKASYGNYGLQDQTAALKWVQANIARFGGDPGKVTLGADRSGADIASLHLMSAFSQGFFQRVLLMGGSALSPATVVSHTKANEQSKALANEVGCPSVDPEQLITCLRETPALTLNTAQTKLLAVSGPFQAWAPVVDGISVQESPFSAFQGSRFHHADLMVGSSAEDGLISRAKNIKKFEELQGRANSKTTFYEALSNSLGGDDSNSFVKDAATWFYSLQHSPSPVGYNVFSRALENATRDLFIICPVLRMASFWAANTRSNVFMYHVPENTAQNSLDLGVPLDVQLVFGYPHQYSTRQLFTQRERSLSLQIMHYMVNFIKSGNPNHPYSFSRLSLSETLPPWSRFLAHPTGDNYKEFGVSLQNRKELRKSECSFWSDYIQTLTASTNKLSRGISEEDDTVATPTDGTKLFGVFHTSVTESKPKSEKDAYN